jgi:FdhD protein
LETTERFPIKRVQSGDLEFVDDTLVKEANVAIELGGRSLIRTTCSPGQMREWVLGYLLSEGFIASPDDVAEIHERQDAFSVALAESAPAKTAPLTPVESGLTVEPDRLLEIAREVQRRATVFERTGGTHAMAIASETDIVSLAEDISRICALEKALGHALVQRADFSRSFAFLSSRVPSRMAAKLARCGVPIVAAVSAPTINAVRLAEELNVCLCGFVRDERLNVYTHGWRVGL